MRKYLKYLIYSLVGAYLFLFFINSTVGNKDGYVSSLYLGTTLFIVYIIANIGSIVYREMPITRVTIDIVFLYVISFFAIVASRSAGYPYNFFLIAIIILVSVAIKERVVDWIERSPARRC